MNSRTIAKTAVLASVALLLSSPLRAQTRSVADGNWINPLTWNNGVPVDGAAAGVVNEVTYGASDSYTGGGFGAGLLVGYDATNPFGLTGSGPGILNQTGGTLNPGYFGVGYGLAGTVNVSGGTMNINGPAFLLGWTTGSTFNVNGGTVNLNGDGGGAGNYRIGHGATSTLNVSSGVFNVSTVAQIANGSSVNVSGTGVLNMTQYFDNTAINVTGGTVNFQRAGGNHLALGTNGTLGISNGQVSATTDFNVSLNADGTVNQSGGTFTQAIGSSLILGAGAAGTGTYNQSGGDLEAETITKGGSAGVYNFSGGTLRSLGALNLTAGGLTANITGTAGTGSTIDTNGNSVIVNADQINLGAGGVLTKVGAGALTINNDRQFNSGTWNVNGGTVNTSAYFGTTGISVDGGTLNINRAGGTHFAFASTSTSNLISGTINVGTDDLNLGLGGNGTFNQTGGTLIVARDLLVGGAGGNGTGSYVMAGGIANIGNSVVVRTGSADIDGTLTVNTAATGGSFIVDTGTTLGGDGVINGNLTLNVDAKFVFSLTDTLTINDGIVSFGGFGIDDLVGLNSSVANGTYTLMDGSATFDFTNVSNFGVEQSFSLGDGKSAYFQGGSLNVVVVPEPSTWMLVGLGFLVLVTTVRRRLHRAI